MDTITFSNRQPLSMDPDRIESWRIGDADSRGFGGMYLKRYPARAGGYHYWYRYVSPCSDTRAVNTYLSRGARPELPETMDYEVISEHDLREASVLAGWEMAEEG
jgi:hypothetical protein